VYRHADGRSGGRRPRGKPYSRQLVAADLLRRYGWTGHDPGRGFDAWEVQHQRELLDVMKQIRPPVIAEFGRTKSSTRACAHAPEPQSQPVRATAMVE